MIGSILAAVTATAPATAPVPPNPCQPAESCRYVEGFSLHDNQGNPHPLRIGQWLTFVVDGRLSLFPGEVVTVDLSKATPVVTDYSVISDADREKALESVVTQQNAQSAAAGQEMLRSAPVAKSPLFDAPPGSLRIAFVQAAGRADMILRISNGFDRALIYKATILVPGRTSATLTTACPLRPSRPGVEGWPMPIYRIDLSDLTLGQPGASAPALQNCK